MTVSDKLFNKFFKASIILGCVIHILLFITIYDQVWGGSSNGMKIEMQQGGLLTLPELVEADTVNRV